MFYGNTSANGCGNWGRAPGLQGNKVDSVFQVVDARRATSELVTREQRQAGRNEHSKQCCYCLLGPWSATTKGDAPHDNRCTVRGGVPSLSVSDGGACAS